MLRGFLICFAQQMRNKIGAQRRHIAFFAFFDLYFPMQNIFLTPIYMLVST